MTWVKVQSITKSFTFDDLKYKIEALYCVSGTVNVDKILFGFRPSTKTESVKF